MSDCKRCAELEAALREIHDTAVTTANAETACEDIAQMVNAALQEAPAQPATVAKPGTWQHLPDCHMVAVVDPCNLPRSLSWRPAIPRGARGDRCPDDCPSEA